MNATLVSELITSAMLFLAAHPLLAGSSRAVAFLGYLFGFSNDAKRRNLIYYADHAAADGPSAGSTLIRTGSVLGVAIILLQNSATSPADGSLMGHEDMSALTLVSLLTIFVIANTLASLRQVALPARKSITHYTAISTFLVAIAWGLNADIPLEVITSSVCVSILLSETLSLLFSGMRQFGLFVVLWAPIAVVAILCRVFSFIICPYLAISFLFIEVASRVRTDRMDRHTIKPTASS